MATRLSVLTGKTEEYPEESAATPDRRIADIIQALNNQSISQSLLMTSLQRIEMQYKDIGTQHMADITASKSRIADLEQQLLDARSQAAALQATLDAERAAHDAEEQDEADADDIDYTPQLNSLGSAIGAQSKLLNDLARKIAVPQKAATIQKPAGYKLRVTRRDGNGAIAEYDLIPNEVH